jgi:mannitol-1-phosphate/altronate dehydrogenase
VPDQNVPRLSRRLPGTLEAPPIRMVHIGVGKFHRAHQAWYTANAPDAADWGIAAFTARRPDMADQLAPQDGLYTLITRSAAGDDFRVIGSLAAVHPSTDHVAYLNYLRRSELAVVTITVTEVGYLAGPDGRLDRTKEAVQTDIAALRGDAEAQVSSVPGKLVAGLLARRSADAAPVTILPYDNLPESGPLTAAVVRDLATDVDDSLLSWIDENVDLATSMVDRITPATSTDDRLERFGNPRVRHQLSQVAPDGSRSCRFAFFRRCVRNGPRTGCRSAARPSLRPGYCIFGATAHRSRTLVQATHKRRRPIRTSPPRYEESSAPGTQIFRPMLILSRRSGNASTR